jgi:hypothetical protein
VGGDLAAELAEQPRVAPDGAMTVATHRRRRVGRLAADQARGAAQRQRPRMHDGRRSRAADQAQQVRWGVRVVGARAQRDQQRKVFDPAREIRQHLEGRPIGPLGVVDHQRQRLLVGQRRAQPEHAVGDHHRRVAGGHGALEEEPARGRGGAVEQSRALLLGGVAQRRLQQRADHPEGEVALQRPGDRPAHEAARVLGQRGAVLEQRALAQAGGGLEDDHAAAAGRDTADRARQDPELDRALDQRRRLRYGDRLRSHDMQVRVRDDRATDHEGPDA